MGTELRRRGTWVSGAAIVGGIVLLSACSSASKSTAPTSPVAPLSGTYTLSSVSEAPGTVTEASFQLGHYTLVRNPCAAGPDGCGESGTYAISADGTSIALTNARSGVTTNEPITLPPAASTSGVLADVETSSLKPLAGTSLVMASPSALFKCDGSLLSFAKSLAFMGNNYSGGVCPPASVSADECAMSCVYPLTCQPDPTTPDNSLCVDHCNDTCGSKTCMPVEYSDPSGQWVCDNDFCGGGCSGQAGTACTNMGNGASNYTCCSDPTVNQANGNCTIPSAITGCSPACADGLACVKGTCEDPCFNKCSSTLQCNAGVCH